MLGDVFAIFCCVNNDTKEEKSEYRKCFPKYVQTLIMCAHAYQFVAYCVSFKGIQL